MTRLKDRAQWMASDPGLRMRSWIEGLPEQLVNAVAVWPIDRTQPLRTRGVVAAAMGGSAMAAEVALYAVAERMPTAVFRTGTLPAWVDDGWLCIACSYSGNTRETLTCYSQAVERRCMVASISAGGVLMEQAAARGSLHRALEPGQPPRTAVGQAVVGLLWVLWTYGIIDDPRVEIREVAATLSSMWAQGVGASAPWETEAGRIAQAVNATYAMVVGAGITRPAAIRWSQQLNENAKLACFPLEIPEMLHNQIEGLEAAARTGAVLILLADPGQTLGEGAAIDYLATLYESLGGVAFVTSGKGVSTLERIFSLMYLGDQVSYLASLLRGMDPTPVERIGHLKKVLAPGST